VTLEQQLMVAGGMTALAALGWALRRIEAGHSTDHAALTASLKADREELRRTMEKDRAEIRAEMKANRDELRNEMGKGRNETRDQYDALREEIGSVAEKVDTLTGTVGAHATALAAHEARTDERMKELARRVEKLESRDHRVAANG
jgi:DNA anti-recombination protein RmuC